jgi:hypothetical protein
VFIIDRWPNFYSTTAGSFIQIISFAKFKSSNPFVINKTLSDSTTAGSFIEIQNDPVQNKRQVHEVIPNPRPGSSDYRIITPSPLYYPAQRNQGGSMRLIFQAK